MDKTVWSLLNFYAYVKYHVKVSFLCTPRKPVTIYWIYGLTRLCGQCTRGFIQRRMRMRLESLAEVMNLFAVRSLSTRPLHLQLFWAYETSTRGDILWYTLTFCQRHWYSGSSFLYHIDGMVTFHTLLKGFRMWSINKPISID